MEHALMHSSALSWFLNWINAALSRHVQHVALDSLLGVLSNRADATAQSLREAASTLAEAGRTAVVQALADLSVAATIAAQLSVAGLLLAAIAWTAGARRAKEPAEEARREEGRAVPARVLVERFPRGHGGIS